MLEEKPFVRLFSPDYADYLSFKNPPSKYLREALNQCCPKLRRASAIVTASVTETKPDSFSVFQKVSAQPARLLSPSHVSKRDQLFFGNF